MKLGDGVKIDLDVLVNTRLLIQANSGGGKSWCLRRLLEQTHGKIQHLVIDPEGEFASLRSKFDYVLAAKRDGDTQVHPKSAKLLAVRLLELGVSAVLDIFELSPDHRKEFVRDFLDALVDAPKHLWHPALVVLDEAHVYCPEKADAVSADAVKSIATRGRKRGFCLIPATQRLSKLDKDVAAECNNKLIGRTVLDVDLKRAADELGFTKADWPSLRDLNAGDFFAYGPALARTVTKFKVGDVQTEHPKAGAHLAPVVPPPTAKVLAVLSKLADLPQEAEKKAATEAELRGEIQRLNRELRAKTHSTLPPAPLTVEVPVLTDADVQMIRRIQGSLDEVSSAVTTVGQEVAALSRSIVARLQSKPAVQTRPQPTKRQIQPVPQRRHVVATGSGEPMASGERKILTVLFHFSQGRTKNQIAVIAGYAVNGGGFNNYLSAMRSKGWIVGSDPIQITNDGIQALGPVDPLPTGDELISHWQRQLGKAERAIFDYLCSVYPQPASKEEIAAETGYEANGGGFNNALGRLRTLELVTRGQNIAASEHLFE